VHRGAVYSEGIDSSVGVRIPIEVEPTVGKYSRDVVARHRASPGDRLLYARNNELGLSESADLLLKGEELVIPTTRHRWPLP